MFRGWKKPTVGEYLLGTVIAFLSGVSVGIALAGWVDRLLGGE